MLAIFFPETSDTDIPITIFPTLMGLGQVLSSIGRTIRTHVNESVLVQWSREALLFGILGHDPESLPKKGIGSGTRLISLIVTIIYFVDWGNYSSP